MEVVMSISGISGSAGYQAYQPPVHKTGGQNTQPVQSTQPQGSVEENQETSVEKGKESPQENQASGSGSVNLYA